MKKNLKESIELTILGGLGLFVATYILSSFLSTPPSRAEFDSLKADTSRHLQNIDSKLKDIKGGQNRLIEHLINRRGNNEKSIQISN